MSRGSGAGVALVSTRKRNCGEVRTTSNVSFTDSRKLRPLACAFVIDGHQRGFFGGSDGTAVSARREIVHDLSRPGLRVVLALEIDKDVRVGLRRPRLVDTALRTPPNG